MTYGAASFPFDFCRDRREIPKHFQLLSLRHFMAPCGTPFAKPSFTMPLGRRRYPRVDAGLHVRLEDSAGRTWGGKTLNLSLGGLKVEFDAPFQPPHQVRLSLDIPDGGPGISAASLMVRRDSNGLAFAFAELERSALERIRTFVNYLLPRQPLKVLIVEDDLTLAELFSDFIRDEGHETLLAESAEAGIALVERFYPDAMIVDLGLPGMSGLELIRLFANQRRLLPSVVLSGVASAEAAGESVRLGALDFVPKPVSLHHLQAILSLLEAQVINLRLADGAAIP